MKQRPLGKTGMQVSEIAFGGVEIGMPYGIGISTADDMLSENDAIRLLETAVDSGMNFFDTARQYGKSESIMGKAFRNKREQVVVATKCKHLKDKDGGIPSPSVLQKILESSLHESLEALQTDYLDVYMLHDSDMRIIEIEEVLRFFEHMKTSGKIRAAGISTYTPEETEKVIASKNWDVVQVPFNLMDQRQGMLFHVAAERGVGVVVRSVLLKGILSEKGRSLHPALSKVESHIQSYSELMQASSTDLPTLATKFALSFDDVSAILIGIDSMKYLKKSLEAADGIYLDEKLLKRARELAYPEPEFLNLHTWSVKGWLE